MQETWVQSLGQEDPLEEGMALHSSILAWSIPWREEPGRLQSMGLQRLGHNWATEHPPIQEALGLLHYKSQHKESQDLATCRPQSSQNDWGFKVEMTHWNLIVIW